MTPQTSPASRRSFLKVSTTAAAAAVATQLVIPRGVHAQANGIIKVGLVGCGGRGSGAVAQALSAGKDVHLTALADMFPDQLDRTLKSLKTSKPEQVKVTPETSFTGFDACQKLIDSGVDVVLLCSPPGFRPAHIKAAVAAGKHIFTEKPMAVDAPGVRSVLESVEAARLKKLNMVAGFCWRYSTPESETYKRILDGQIGDVRAVYGVYNTSGLWNKTRKPEWSDMEWQIRNWLYFTWLSGDHIVEQAVHTIDKIGWAFNDRPPLSAVAHGGRQTRTDPAYGHIFDHFSVVYEFPNDARGFLFCRQQDGCHVDVSDYITGTKGTANVRGFTDIHRFRGLDNKITWKFEGEANNLYQAEHDVLFDAVRTGKVVNDGARMMNSTMMAILGRMAAYTGQTVKWEDAMNSKENLMPAQLELGSIAVPPVAMPGRTRMV